MRHLFPQSTFNQKVVRNGEYGSNISARELAAQKRVGSWQPTLLAVRKGTLQPAASAVKFCSMHFLPLTAHFNAPYFTQKQPMKKDILEVLPYCCFLQCLLRE